jgi:transcriptional regulator
MEDPMYLPPAFRESLEGIHATMRSARLAHFITATAEGPLASALPLIFDDSEGEHGTVYGHFAKGNAHWRSAPIGDALAIFMGPEAYVTPSWYPTKQETGKVVPTWNYVSVHASGPVEFFHEPERLLDVVTRLTALHEKARTAPWAVNDAPSDFIASQLRGIVGLRMPITRLEGKRKMSQNRNEADRAGVAAGLAERDLPQDKEVASLIPVADQKG